MLIVEPNIAQPDEVYESLLAMHHDLTPEQSRDVNARLILLLCNHIGDPAVLHDAFARARAGVEPAGDDHTLPASA